jgi:L-fuconolactonase
MNVIDTHCHIIAPDQSRYPRAPLGGKQSGWEAAA